MRTKTTIAAAALALAALAPGAGAQEKITFRLDWTFYGAHAPFYLGVAKGLYKAEGLDVTIAEGNGSGNTAKVVAQGNDPLGFMDYGTMVKGVAGGMPLVAIFGVHQKNPMVIISHADAPLKSPKDLEGKVVAMAPAESTAQMYPVMMAAAGVDPAKVNVLAPAVGAKSALFLQKRADAITGVTYFHIPQLEAQGAKLHTFSYADFGVTALEGGIVANAEWLAKNGAAAKRFLKATAAAWAAAKANPAGAVDAAVKAKPELEKTRAVHLRQLALTFEIVETSNTKGKPLGTMSEADWKAMLDVLEKTKQIAQPIAPEKVFTNAHVPQ